MEVTRMKAHGRNFMFSTIVLLMLLTYADFKIMTLMKQLAKRKARGKMGRSNVSTAISIMQSNDTIQTIHDSSLPLPLS